MAIDPEEAARLLTELEWRHRRRWELNEKGGPLRVYSSQEELDADNAEMREHNRVIARMADQLTEIFHSVNFKQPALGSTHPNELEALIEQAKTRLPRPLRPRQPATAIEKVSTETVNELAEPGDLPPINWGPIGAFLAIVGIVITLAVAGVIPSPF